MTATVRRLLVDWVPSLAVAGIGTHELLYNHAPLWQWASVALTVLVLPLRRRAPVAVLVVAVVLVLADWADGVLLVSNLGVLVALHAVAWKRRRLPALLWAAVVEAAAVYAAFRFGPTGSVNDAVVLLTGLTLSALFLGTTQRAQERYLLALEERTEQLRRERNQRAEIAAAAERTRIAREVHDIVAHSVSVMVAMSEGAARAPDEPTARSTMRQVAATGREALGELRRVLSVLHGPDDRQPQPSLTALPDLVRDVERTGLAVRLEVDGDVTGLPDGLQATVFRIVQESLTNTMKHATDARTAEVRVGVGEHEVAVVVADDGRAGGSGSTTGNGIRGMSERARMFGGAVVAGVEEDGWVVRCVLQREPAVLR